MARHADGTFAVANSTGGTTLMLHGRVGDSPIYGAGLYAGPRGGVAATGQGEEIVKRLLCYRIYERMAAGASPEEAGLRRPRRVPRRRSHRPDRGRGRGDWGGSNREMPYAIASEGP